MRRRGRGDQGSRDRAPVPLRASPWVDVARVVVGAGLTAITWREAAAPDLPAWEEPAFRAVNGLPEAGRLVWPVMQFGSFAAIPVVAVAVDRLSGDRRFAVSVGSAGLAAYLTAKVVKRRVGRGRPADVYVDVRRREHATGFGYPSGHAAEAAAMASVVAARLPVGWQWVPVALVGAVGAGRLFVGAHLPHDVLGGAAMGATIGGGANLLDRALPGARGTRRSRARRNRGASLGGERP